jgi:hypothetical protein
MQAGSVIYRTSLLRLIGGILSVLRLMLVEEHRPGTKIDPSKAQIRQTQSLHLFRDAPRQVTLCWRPNPSGPPAGGTYLGKTEVL